MLIFNKGDIILLHSYLVIHITLFLLALVNMSQGEKTIQERIIFQTCDFPTFLTADQEEK